MYEKEAPIIKPIFPLIDKIDSSKFSGCLFKVFAQLPVTADYWSWTHS